MPLIGCAASSALSYCLKEDLTSLAPSSVRCNIAEGSVLLFKQIGTSTTDAE